MKNFFGKPYDISCLNFFGCLCYANTITAHRKKLDDRSVRGIFLGFPHNTKGYIYLNLKYHSINISRNVIFHENCFPYKLDCGLTRGPHTLSLPIHNAYNTASDFFFLTRYQLETISIILNSALQLTQSHWKLQQSNQKLQ